MLFLNSENKGNTVVKMAMMRISEKNLERLKYFRVVCEEPLDSALGRLIDNTDKEQLVKKVAVELEEQLKKNNFCIG